MKNNKKTIIITMCVAMIPLLIALIPILKKHSSRGQEISTTNKIDEYDANVINEIKEEINATADTDMYKIEEEYDGRKIIQIKPNIQFETVLAGVLKSDKPEQQEIKTILEKRPTKSGIWISEKSREKFLEILKANNISQFEIDKDGYLKSKEESNNKNYKKFKSAIESDKLYIIDILGKCYIRDEISGKIVEYPFEKMEPDQAVEIYSNENSVIIEVTTNSRGNLSNEEIFEDFISNI